MNTFLRIITGFAFVGLVFTSLESARPSWATHLGLDWWSLPELFQSLLEAEEESARLDEVKAQVQDRLETHSALIQDVLKDRITLFAAAATLRARGEAPGAPPDMTLRTYPGSTPEEKFCRRLIAGVRSDPTQEFGRHAEVVARRLEAELAEYLQLYGTRSLPTPTLDQMDTRDY